MMIPDYCLIGEIMLYSYGIESASVLAVKIVKSLKLASEQASSQPHYDYGMRAMKSIVGYAGMLKIENPNMSD